MKKILNTAASLLVFSIGSIAIAQTQGAPAAGQPRVQPPAQSTAHSVAKTPELKATYDDILKTLGSVPFFIRDMAPEVVPGLWQESKSLLLNPGTALPQKYKALIALAVASQASCKNCVFFDTEASKMEGASPLEMKESLAMAGLTRHWSTFLNGSQIDPVAFRREVGDIFKGLLDRRARAQAGEAQPSEQEAGEVPAAAPSALPQSELDRTFEDIQMTFGQVPLFMRSFPQDGLPAAWNAMKSLQLNPDTAIPPKYKELIGLAVAAQIPCWYCTLFHTEAAKFNGASADEVKETLAVAALARQRDTAISTLTQDDAQFRRETMSIFRYVGSHRARQQLGGASPSSPGASGP